MAHPPEADVEMLSAPLAFDGPELEAIETRLETTKSKASQDGALRTVLCTAASEVLNRPAGQSGPSFRGDQQVVMEHIVSSARSAFYIAPCDAGRSLVLWVLAVWTRRIVVIITPTNTLAASHCTAVMTALGGKSCTVVPLRVARAAHARGAADGVGARTRAARAGRALHLATATPGRRTCLVNEASLADLLTPLCRAVPSATARARHGAEHSLLDPSFCFCRPCAPLAAACTPAPPCARAPHATGAPPTASCWARDL